MSVEVRKKEDDRAGGEGWESVRSGMGRASTWGWVKPPHTLLGRVSH